MASSETVTTSAYVVLRARLDWDEFAIKVNFSVPRSIFEQITPEATIEVPESFVVRPHTEVTVTEPDGD